jgi:hypothetical protein
VPVKYGGVFFAHTLVRYLYVYMGNIPVMYGSFLSIIPVTYRGLYTHNIPVGYGGVYIAITPIVHGVVYIAVIRDRHGGYFLP